MGNVTNNSNFGIFGILSDEKIAEYQNIEKMTVGLRSSIRLGEAKIISNFSGERKEYRVMIDKIYLNDVDDNKSFVIRIIDDELINETRWNNKRIISEVRLFRMDNL